MYLKRREQNISFSKITWNSRCGFGLWVWIGSHFDQFWVTLQKIAKFSTILQKNAKKAFLQLPDSNQRKSIRTEPIFLKNWDLLELSRFFEKLSHRLFYTKVRNDLFTFSPYFRWRHPVDTDVIFTSTATICALQIRGYFHFWGCLEVKMEFCENL